MKRTGFDAPSEAAALLSIDDLPLPYLEIDACGIVMRANRAALDMHPPDQGELLGQFVFSFLAGGDREASSLEFAAMLESCGDQPQTVVRYIYDRSGKYSAYRIYRSVMRDAAGIPTGMRIMAVNVSEATEALEETHRRNLWLESVVDSVHEAIVVIDTTGIITGINSATERLLGWTAAELTGRVFESGIQLRSFHAGDKSPITFAMVLANRCNGLATLVDRHGSEVVIRVWATPLLDKESGSVAGVVLTMYKPGAPMIVPG